MTEEHIKKLPKWAQMKFHILTMDYDSLLKKYNEMEGIEKTNTYYRNYKDRKRLPNNAEIIFELPDGKIEVRIERNNLRIYALEKKEKTFVILPKITNVIEVGFMD